jgi:hypothetical protein
MKRNVSPGLKRTWWPLLLVLLLLLSFPTGAMAKGLLEHQDTVVPEGQTVYDVVVLGGDATISGTVEDSVIVFNGDVHLEASAVVNGFVLVVGGNVQQENGASVADEVVAISLDTATQNSLLIGGGMVVGMWLLQLAIFVVLVLLSVAIAAVGKRRFASFVNRGSQAPGRTIYIGFFSGLILAALILLLLLSVIGIPVAVLLLLLGLVAFVFGMAVLSMLVGERIHGAAGRSPWLTACIGAVVLAALLNIPLIGFILSVCMELFALGLLSLWVLERRKRKAA